MNKTNRICFATDIHGDMQKLAQLEEVIEIEQPGTLILGGDTCPTAFHNHGVEEQRHWLETNFREFLERIQPVQTFWCSGNHDLFGALDIVEELEQNGLLVNCNLKWLELESGWQAIGMPYCPVSGNPYGDWHRLEANNKIPSYVPEISYISSSGKIQAINSREYLGSLSSIKKILNEIPQSDDPQKAIFIAHCPPFIRTLDSGAKKRLGSRAILKHIQEKGYALTCHGHIHESPYVSGAWSTRIGNSWSINPGQWDENLHAVIIDLSHFPESGRHLLFGSMVQGKSPRRKRSEIQKEIQSKWESAGFVARQSRIRMLVNKIVGYFVNKDKV
jgi:Icc-related predicted phosphoesterase